MEDYCQGRAPHSVSILDYYIEYYKIANQIFFLSSLSELLRESWDPSSSFVVVEGKLPLPPLFLPMPIITYVESCS